MHNIKDKSEFQEPNAQRAYPLLEQQRNHISLFGKHLALDGVE